MEKIITRGFGKRVTLSVIFSRPCWEKCSSHIHILVYNRVFKGTREILEASIGKSIWRFTRTFNHRRKYESNKI